MRCADFVAPGHVVFRDGATEPVAAEGEVLVAVEACGICGSDLHMFRNGTHSALLTRPTPEGYRVPGHEFAGRIAALGTGVSGWSIGERVVGVTGQGGGMAEHVAVPVNPFQLVRVPEGVSAIAAATTEPLADALQMVRKAAIAAGEAVVVFGVGIIGLGVIQAIRAKGLLPRRLLAIDVHPARLAKALALGATHAVNARDGDVFAAVAAVCGEFEDYRGRSAGVDVVFDCAGYIANMGAEAPLETALRLVSTRGSRIICFGAFEDRVSIDLNPVIQKEPLIIGSNGYAAEELVEALELMRLGRVDREGLVSHRLPIEQAAEAFAMQCSPEAIKVVLRIDDGADAHPNT
jgi:threonine dehydrogenase-like Zn-dependent dehydrogenase